MWTETNISNTLIYVTTTKNRCYHCMSYHMFSSFILQDLSLIISQASFIAYKAYNHWDNLWELSHSQQW